MSKVEGGGGPVGMTVVLLRGCNRRFSIFRCSSSKILLKEKIGIF